MEGELACLREATEPKRNAPLGTHALKKKRSEAVRPCIEERVGAGPTIFFWAYYERDAPVFPIFVKQLQIYIRKVRSVTHRTPTNSILR